MDTYDNNYSITEMTHGYTICEKCKENIILFYQRADVYQLGLCIRSMLNSGNYYTQENVINMGVTSYSPIVYSRKIQHYIENGLNIDEVIVFIDISDVNF